MEIKIDSKEIDNYIKESLIKSSIGEALNKAIKEQLEKINYAYNSAVQEYVRTYVKKLAEEILINHKDEIYHVIASKVSPNVISSIVSSGVDAFMREAKDYSERT